jgi:hypothetical protein
MDHWFDKKKHDIYIYIYSEICWYIKNNTPISEQVPNHSVFAHGCSLDMTLAVSYSHHASRINHQQLTLITPIHWHKPYSCLHNLRLMIFISYAMYVSLSLRHLLYTRHVCQWIYAVQYIMTKSLNTGKRVSLWNQQVQGSIIASQCFVQTCVRGWWHSAHFCIINDTV